ncbi:MAG: phosphoribosylamine--glycine ligase [Cyclobacteriaceae bacterium]|nr:phosphoribosylamine--glycine ligase [Cyclobacteriaceae bacterium]
MNILVIGSGGREHTFAWKLRQSKKCKNLYVAPGNAGTENTATNVAIPIDDFEGIKNLIFDKDISLVIVGPEAPLVNGIRAYLLQDPRLKDLRVVGPGTEGAKLEGSKDYAKNFMVKHGIPTAHSQTFGKDQLEEAKNYLKSVSYPIVLKADGLAAGKGVIICQDVEEATLTIDKMLAHSMFGQASERVVIEQFLKGIELSVFVLTDGHSYKILPEAKDYKPIGENNTGPNTGGMGSISPVNFAQGEFLRKVEERVIIPTINGLKSDHIDYKGFVFIGLMNVEGDPYVIEYNVRMGDPETEVVLPRIKSDLVDLMLATAEGSLSEISLEIDPKTASTVVMVAGGYPDDYEKGMPISGLDNTDDNTIVFHAGTKTAHGQIVTNGGRVLAVTGIGTSMLEALEKSYERVSKIHWNNVYFRKDIGHDLNALS